MTTFKCPNCSRLWQESPTRDYRETWCWVCQAEAHETTTEQRDRYREALEEVKAFVCGEAVTKWSTDLQTTNSRIRIANTCDVALLPTPKHERVFQGKGELERTGYIDPAPETELTRALKALVPNQPE